MTILSTPRTWLLPLTRSMIRRRLDTASFDLDCAGPDGPLRVHFPPEWPGDPLHFFPTLLARVPAGQEDVAPDTSFTVVTRQHPEAIGQLGTTTHVTADGDVEIGYGMNPAVWGQGYATEAVGALVAHLHTLPGVRRVTADTALSNRASERVLEKLGFTRTGVGWTAEDGDLTTWAHGQP
ncbi:RimJ/RimL family protein N-acetyltransferase [Deinococcus metalli]|uniref:N-acetyltransferase n=1 Tax=Deinococcus metalli TaxID=1141878 RepID=A0A7W8NN05_9DEIO|nr:GNAT family N-acetyltransferase [Deinococcus metalli]MBB5376369.1 RimJ/RimL family protein N-acetyltransferase [Deinococcus metalli]GHF38803.1 N-acetyltransferase [Deinococcus metalli]